MDPIAFAGLRVMSDMDAHFVGVSQIRFGYVLPHASQFAHEC